MSLYDLTFKDSSGSEVALEQYRGKVLLIVNTATKCGLAPQFKELEQIYQKYTSKNFSIIGFPSNQFANQEPESNETMAHTCQINFGVTFLLSEKIFVNGKNTHPVFAFLKENSKNGILGKSIKWNFTKFLISSDGKKIKRYPPTTKPLDIENDILSFLHEEKRNNE